jgi:predicted site-specific integrase-resolvase
MEIGYARVSTQDQYPALQLDALHAAGCAKVFVEQASGAQRDRPQLQAALDYARSGDTLVFWKLDRLARSLKQLIETIELLTARELTAAKAMLADHTLTVEDVARQLRVAPSTLYRHFPGGRSALRDGQA